MKDIHRTIIIKAPAKDIFNALTNPLTIELWTGYPAEMEPVAGTEFSLWEGDISGRNLEIEPGKKIVQEWFFGDENKPSVVTIELNEVKGNTTVELTHTNVPDEAFENIDYGWKEYYFGALKKFLEE